MAVSYATEVHYSDFRIDLKKQSDCKGAYRVEIRVPKDSVPLLVDDGSGQIIDCCNPYIMECASPMTVFNQRFKFNEKEALKPNNSEKTAVVRYLYVD